MAPLGPEAWHEHRHSLISGIGGPSSFRVRNFALPVGAPTGIVLPLAVGLDTLHAAQAFTSQRLPMAASGWYWPNTWYPKLSELPGVASVEIGHEQMISLPRRRLVKPGIRWPRVLLKQKPPSHWP